MSTPPATSDAPDTPDPASAHPILTIEDSKRLEAALFAADETREWPAMQRAGRAIADAILRDYREIGDFPPDARILVLVGKGHNGGDALLAAKHILEQHPRARADICFAFGECALRPLAMRAWQELTHAAPQNAAQASKPAPVTYDLCLDGIFGFQFRPPLDKRTAALIASVNAHPIRLRAAVDLPSGLGDKTTFHADFTYATGIVKLPVLDSPHTGRLRYLDLGFFSGTGDSPVGSGGMGDSPMCLGSTLSGASESRASRPCHSVLTPAILAPLRALRPAHTDKRDYGHLFIIGGSRDYPGAVLMSVLAALRGGAGLVTAFVPETLVPAFAARAPEAIWRGLAETPDGALALENISLFRERFAEKPKPNSATTTGAAASTVNRKLKTVNSAGGSAANPTALLLGPGLSREPETLALAADIVRATPADIPLVIDADALQPDIISAGAAPRILTPHAGEYARIAAAIPKNKNTIIVRKAPLTRIERASAWERQSPDWPAAQTDANRQIGVPAYISPFGGPVLARGGSGDLLAGIIGTQLAQTPQTPLLAACRGAAWHGLAADCLARARGQHAVRVTELLDHLSEALRSE